MPATKNVLAIVGGISIAALILKQAADNLLQNVIVTLGNPQMDSTPFAQGFLKVDVPVTIENRNPIPLGLKYFRGVVTYGQVRLSNVSIDTPFTVPPGGTRTINLNMDIPIDKVLNDLVGLFENGNVWNALLNKIELNGQLQIQGNFTDIPLPITGIAIPIV